MGSKQIMEALRRRNREQSKILELVKEAQEYFALAENAKKRGEYTLALANLRIADRLVELWIEKEKKFAKKWYSYNHQKTSWSHE